MVVAAFLIASGCGSNGGAAPPPPPPPSPSGYPDPPPTPVPPPGDTVYWQVLRVIYNLDGSSSTSYECYAFYPDDSVELSHSGTLTDTGQYSGDYSGYGEIAWDSGRSSTVVWDSDAYKINGVRAAAATGC
jgi:hypothetical protein